MADEINLVKIDVATLTAELNNTNNAVEKLATTIEEIRKKVEDINVNVAKIDQHIDTIAVVNKSLLGIGVAIVGFLIRFYIFGVS